MTLLSMFKRKKAKKVSIKKEKKIKRKPKKTIKVKPKKKIIKKKFIKKVKPKKIKKPIVKKVIKPKLPEIQKIKDEKAYKLLKSSGVPVAKYIFCKGEKDLQFAKRIGFPSIMSISSQKPIEPVKIKIDSNDQVLENFNKLMKTKNAEAILVQKEIQGLELLIGVKSDSQFGYIISSSLGGMYKEILRDVVFRISPITSNDAEGMIRELKGYDILEKNSVKLDRLYNILVNLSKLAMKQKLNQVNIRLICNKDGCWAIDTKIIR